MGCKWEPWAVKFLLKPFWCWKHIVMSHYHWLHHCVRTHSLFINVELHNLDDMIRAQPRKDQFLLLLGPVTKNLVGYLLCCIILEHRSYNPDILTPKSRKVTKKWVYLWSWTTLALNISKDNSLVQSRCENETEETKYLHH